MIQQSLFKEKRVLEFGGSLNTGKRKTQRPLNSKLALHLVLKASSSFILLRNKTLIEQTIQKMNTKFSIKKYALGIHADHLHLNGKFPSREIYKKWVRAVTGVLARKLKLKWRLRPYTRIISWGRQFKQLQNYIQFNQREGDLMLHAYETMERWRSHSRAYALPDYLANSTA